MGPQNMGANGKKKNGRNINTLIPPHINGGRIIIGCILLTTTTVLRRALTLMLLLLPILMLLPPPGRFLSPPPGLLIDSLSLLARLPSAALFVVVLSLPPAAVSLLPRSATVLSPAPCAPPLPVVRSLLPRLAAFTLPAPVSRLCLAELMERSCCLG
jgi:hypothetical protein